jgi:hypothetical protein
LELISIFTLKTTINNLFITSEVSSERPPRINKKFRFLAK